MSKTVTTRIKQKHDLEVNWLKATNFVPFQGELIVYDIEVDKDGNTLSLPAGRSKPYTFERLKIGDGINTISDLPFANSWAIIEHEEQEIILTGGTAEDFIVPEEILEGTGSEYYTTAPSTLSFRSTAPLEEFQEVQINGQTVGSSNYTLEEGSTIVKLSPEYLKTLDTGNHKISIISSSQTARGNFTVAAPVLNEYGFYYNVPYHSPEKILTTSELANKWSCNMILSITALMSFSEEAVSDLLSESTQLHEFAVIFKEDGTAKFIDISYFEDSDIEIISSTFDQGIITFQIDELQYSGRFSADGSELTANIAIPDGFFENPQPAATDRLLVNPEIIAADYDYLYIKRDDTICFTTHNNLKTEYLPVKSDIMGQPVESCCNFAFANNTSLIEAPELPETLKHLGDNMFSNCTALQKVVLPNNLSRISDFAFENCSSLSELLIPASIEYIGDSVFRGCSNLIYITFEGTIAQWNAVYKGEHWNDESSIKYVQCSDGQIEI